LTKKHEINNFQVAKVRFNSKTKSFEGLIQDPMTDRTGVVEQLEDDWVRKNLDDDFLVDLETRAEKSSRFIRVPVGKSMPLTKIPENLTTEDAPYLYFCQGDKNTCITDSLASALVYQQNLIWAKRIHDLGIEFLGRTSQNSQPLIVEVVNTLRKNREYQPKKIDHKTPIDELIRPSNYLRTIVLKSSDGQSNHAVSLIEQWVFDSNIPVALKLCKDSLDFCCGQNCSCVGIVNGYEFGPESNLKLLKPKKSATSRKRKRSGSRSKGK
jgi:hypothetical protein